MLQGTKSHNNIKGIVIKQLHFRGYSGRMFFFIKNKQLALLAMHILNYIFAKV